MPSNSLVYSFPAPLGRRGSVALAVGALHVLLAFALVTGLAVRIAPTADPPPLKVLPVAPRPIERTATPPSPVTAEDFTRPPVDAPPLPDDVVAPPDPADAIRAAPDADTTAHPPLGGSGPQILTGPKVLHGDEPVYPAASRRLGEHGSVVVRVRVDALGRAEAVEVAESSGYARLDEAAVRAVQRWRFAPARSGRDAIAAWVTLKVTFRLQG